MTDTRRVLCCLLLLMAGPGFSAEEDAGLWLTGSYSTDLGERLSAGLMAQPRFIDDGETLQRWLLRPSLSYRLTPHFSVAGGYDYHKIKLPRSRREQRLWQQLSFRTAAAGPAVFGHLRLEERFIESVDDAYQLRLKAGVRHPLFGTPWSAVVSDEVFVGLNEVAGGPDDGFAQNRLFAGLARRLSPRLGLEVGYQNQYIDGARVDTSNHLLLVSFAFQ